MSFACTLDKIYVASGHVTGTAVVAPPIGAITLAMALLSAKRSQLQSTEDELSSSSCMWQQHLHSAMASLQGMS